MRLLLIESSKTITSLVLNELELLIDIEVDWASTQREALEFIQTNGADAYKLAVSCLNLSDAQEGEIIASVTKRNIPTIIFSAKFDYKMREKLMKTPGVVDYVVKESKTALKYLCAMVRRLIINEHIKTLVVDDSGPARSYVAGLLRQYRFQVFEASSGAEALEILAQNRDIKLVIADYQMQNIDGFDLTKKIRETYDKESLAVIGMSAAEEPVLSARFIKIGANDFVKKPFEPEELFCRVTQNMDLIEKTKALTDAATRDFLTSLYNRRFFFEHGQGKINRARRENKNLALAMLDIDHFKSVNDSFGHDVGDEVLKRVSGLLLENVRKGDIVARMGGEEFCILLEDISPSDLKALFETMRSRIAALPFESLGERTHVTSSFGLIIAREGESLDGMVKRADELLYLSKESGRNCVTFKE